MSGSALGALSCPSCGTSMQPSMKLCPQCGVPVGASDSTTARSTELVAVRWTPDAEGEALGAATGAADASRTAGSATGPAGQRTSSEAATGGALSPKVTRPVPPQPLRLLDAFTQPPDPATANEASETSDGEPAMVPEPESPSAAALRRALSTPLALVEALERLHALFERGALTGDEYTRAKDTVIVLARSAGLDATGRDAIPPPATHDDAAASSLRPIPVVLPAAQPVEPAPAPPAPEADAPEPPPDAAASTSADAASPASDSAEDDASLPPLAPPPDSEMGDAPPPPRGSTPDSTGDALLPPLAPGADAPEDDATLPPLGSTPDSSKGDATLPPLAPPPDSQAGDAALPPLLPPAPLAPPAPSPAAPPMVSAASPAKSSSPSRRRELSLGRLIGALGSAGIIIGAFLHWTAAGAVSALDIPLVPLFVTSSTTTQPRLGYVLIGLGVLGIVASLVRSLRWVRALCGLLALGLTALFVARIDDVVSGASGGVLDLLGPGPFVSGIAAIGLTISALLPDTRKPKTNWA
jgi:hypothetical protein